MQPTYKHLPFSCYYKSNLQCANKANIKRDTHQCFTTWVAASLWDEGECTEPKNANDDGFQMFVACLLDIKINLEKCPWRRCKPHLTFSYTFEPSSRTRWRRSRSSKNIRTDVSILKCARQDENRIEETAKRACYSSKWNMHLSRDNTI